jgi:lysophospholipase L1-like esterase
MFTNRMFLTFSIAAAIVALLAVGTMLRTYSNTTPSSGSTHIVLVGASIGQGWRLADWPSRTNTRTITAESIAVWQFDKSSAVNELARRPRRTFHFSRSYLRSLLQPPPKVPRVVILKECSSYFPGNFDDYKTLIQSWTNTLRANGTVVVLATVAPVTQERSLRAPGKLEGIVEFNRWIREYAKQQRLPLLDLETALRVGNGFTLRDDLAAEDGSHLNPAAYAVLDKLLQQVLCEMNIGVPCSPAPAFSAR